jgi:hypothetical protein
MATAPKNKHAKASSYWESPAMKKETHTFSVETTIPAIYYAGRGGYAIEHKGGFIPLTTECQVKQHLVAAEVPDDQFTEILCRIRLENFVS